MYEAIEIAALIIELAQTDEPMIQMFLLFFAVMFGIPFFGGIIIMMYNFTKEDTTKPPRAFSYIPFCGTLVEFTMVYLI